MCGISSGDFSTKMLRVFLTKYDIVPSEKAGDVRKQATKLKHKLDITWFQIFNIEEVQSAREFK